MCNISLEQFLFETFSKMGFSKVLKLNVSEEIHSYEKNSKKNQIFFVNYYMLPSKIDRKLEKIEVFVLKNFGLRLKSFLLSAFGISELSSKLKLFIHPKFSYCE